MKILRSREAWDFLLDVYHERFDNENAPSFIDFFYTWRFTHVPLFKILTADIPRAQVYHSFCTGYAGLAASVAKLKYGRPFILSEHGIYSNEREIEISMADWIHQSQTDFRAKEQASTFKRWWINLFLFMGRVAYLYADDITSLFYGNRTKQIQYGADPHEISVIPNGIKYEQFASIEKQPSDTRTIGLVGRVVPIKDIKTFIKSAAIIAERYAGPVEFLIMGPTDEDIGYFKNCQQLVKILGLEQKIRFTGKINVSEYYPKLDVPALSSISEGQPLVLLEAMCLGIPAVTTDVGACAEILHGMDDDDRKLGHAGRVVPMGRAEPLADAILEILNDSELTRQMGEVGRKRVKSVYHEDENILKYNRLYSRHLQNRFR